jgi:hypothetical protein
MCYELEGARDEHTNERNLKRVKRDCSSFSDPGRRCITRLREQLIERFSIIDEDTIIPLFCDPRTKDVVGSIILDADKQNIPSTSSGALVESARQKFIDEHLKVFKLMSAARQPTPNSDGSHSPSSSPLIHDLPQHDSADLLGPPIPTTTTEAIQESTIRQEAEAALQKWFSHKDDWISVARDQATTKVTHKEMMKKLCRQRADGRPCWDLIELYNHVDVCQWFRQRGESLFPSIALLSRIWLGRSMSTAFQERVFSSAGAVMSSSRTSMDAERAEKLVILKHNAKEIDLMQSESSSGPH